MDINEACNTLSGLLRREVRPASVERMLGTDPLYKSDKLQPENYPVTDGHRDIPAERIPELADAIKAETYNRFAGVPF